MTFDFTIAELLSQWQLHEYSVEADNYEMAVDIMKKEIENDMPMLEHYVQTVDGDIEDYLAKELFYNFTNDLGYYEEKFINLN